jgi:hypothetical protein
VTLFLLPLFLLPGRISSDPFSAPDGVDAFLEADAARIAAEADDAPPSRAAA